MKKTIDVVVSEARGKMYVDIIAEPAVYELIKSIGEQNYRRIPQYVCIIRYLMDQYKFNIKVVPKEG